MGRAAANDVPTAAATAATYDDAADAKSAGIHHFFNLIRI